MKIGIFGGAFNPIHSGHLLIAEQFIDFKIVDEVWLLPCYSHVWNKELASPEHREKMIDLAIENLKFENSLSRRSGIPQFAGKIVNCKLEIMQQKPMYTINTVKLLFKKYPQHNLFWILGSDNLQTFDKWHEKEELLKLIHFYVAPKSGVPIPDKLSPNMEAVKNPLWVETNLSSTIIRDRIKKGLSISSLVPPEVEEYIIKNRLYA